MAGLPTGTVTFLFTDLEVSTHLWDEHPEAMQVALARHDEILRGMITAHDGHVVKMRGDGAHAAFPIAPAAVRAAIAAQVALSREPWGDTGPLRVRMGIHTGTAEVRDGDYFGTEVNRAARLMAVAHGGQVVCSQASADLVRGALDAECVLVDLGLQQLRGLQTPERVFQVTHPDLPSDFPPLRTLDAFPGNLPAQVTGFVGRDDEQAAVVHLLVRSRVVTLTGSGGVGKTRLAVQVASVAVPHFADGAWFVDLAEIDDEAFVPSAIASAMGLPERRQGTREEALVGVLGRRNALLVLDNCEHLVDAVAQLVHMVVHECPGITVLATSQEGLGVAGEATFVVRPLREEEATQLFVERATAARHDFVLSTENAPVVSELCRRLDGIPLAIELAAARVASMSPSTILARIDERFRLLGQLRRTARRRHQTLRAAVDWSYGLLEPAEQLVFARLAVFIGDFTLEAAEEVVADDQVDGIDVLDIVSGLVAKSMVHLGERSGVDSYRLLETMREYGLERLGEHGELERLQRRHAVHYSRFAEEAAPHLVGRDDIEWTRRISDESPNLRAALSYLWEDDPGGYLRLVTTLGQFWWLGGHFREGLGWLTAAPPEDPTEPAHQRAERLAVGGNLAMILDRYEEGLALIDESVACSVAADEPPSSIALLGLGLAALVQNRSDDARRFSEEAISVARASGDAYRLATVLAYASSTVGMSGDADEGVSLADEAVTIARTLGNSNLLMNAVQAAAIARSRTDPTRAIELFDEAFALPVAGFRRATTAYTWKAVAHVMLRQYASAASELCVAVPLLQENGELYQHTIAIAVAASVLSHSAPEVALLLLAALDQQRDDGRVIGAAGDLAVQAHLVDRLRTRLDDAVFATHWVDGHALTLERATTLALDHLAAVADET